MIAAAISHLILDYFQHSLSCIPITSLVAAVLTFVPAVGDSSVYQQFLRGSKFSDQRLLREKKGHMVPGIATKEHWTQEVKKNPGRETDMEE